MKPGINDLEHKEGKKQPIRMARRKENSKNNKDTVIILWDSFKQSNIRFRGLPEGEEKE